MTTCRWIAYFDEAELEVVRSPARPAPVTENLDVADVDWRDVRRRVEQGESA